jgi:two-component system response regulator
MRELKKNNMTNHLVHLKNGKEALDFIFAEENLTNPPKVILLDIQMPKINGIQVLQKIKEDPRTRAFPVVMLTSSKESPDIQKCYDLGANSYIVKPVNFEGFAAAIKNLGLYWLLLNQPPENK